MDELHLLRPYWLLALLPLNWLLYRGYVRLGQSNQWRDQIDPALLQHVLVGESSSGSKSVLVAVGLLWFLAVLALAGPTFEKLPSPVYRGLAERVLIVDLSLSMDAQDVKPSRLVRATQKLQDILTKTADNQTALIVFSAVPYVISPLTDDVQTIRSLLPSLATDIVPAQGSSTSRALTKGLELLQQSGSRQGSLWLLTDSPPDAGSEQVARSISSAGYRLNVLGIGSAEGAPIPAAAGGFVKYNGDIVIAKMDSKPLLELARIAGGTYSNTTSTDSDIDKLLSADQLQGNRVSEDGAERQTDRWLERGPFLVLLLLPFAALCFRRGWL